MKTFALFVVLALALNVNAADALTEKLQRGLFEEEANHNLDAAIKEYQSVVAQSDEQRKVTATALFRLGECYRKLGKTNEASAQYQRILRDFSEQEQLVRLANDLLKPAATAVTAGNQPEFVQQLKSRIATLRIESIAQQMESDRLAKLSDHEVLQAAGTNDALLGQLRTQGLAAGHKLNLLRQQLGEQHPDVKAQQALVETITKQLIEAAKGLRIAAKMRAEDSVALLNTLREELKKAEAAPNATPAAEVAATDEEEKEVRRIQAMIKDSPDLINARENAANTPLHQAAARGQLVVAKFLLANKADLSARAASGDTALHFAALYGHKSMVELLIENGADVNVSHSNGDTPLHVAARKGFRAVVETLLARKADIHARNNQHETSLHVAVQHGFQSVAELLLSKGADPNAKGLNDATPLHYAAQSSSKSLVELLLARGADIDARRSNDKATPLYFAVSRKNNTSMAEALLVNKANPNLADNYGTTPLMLATSEGNAALVEMLLTNKANPNLADRNGGTPLLRATEKPSLPLVNLLLAHGADPNIGDANGVTPLHRVSITGDAGIAEALLKHKAATDKKVTWALGGTQVPTYQRPENYNTEIANGATPLWLALENVHLKVAELLLSFSAPVNDRITTTLGGRTTFTMPLELALNKGNKEMVKLLLERKANPNIVDAASGKFTPLMRAVGTGNREIVELLLAHGAEVNVLSDNGHTALALAQRAAERQPPASSSSRETVELLLKHGAIEDLQRSSSVTVARGTIKHTVFNADTNNLNRFTLFETIAQFYSANISPSLVFPDFSRVKLKRLQGKTPNEETILDLDTAFKFADCTKDQWLEWGDLIEIPELDHRLNEVWSGLSEPVREVLRKCLQKKVRIIVKGQTNLVILKWTFSSSGMSPWSPGSQHFENRVPTIPVRPLQTTPVLSPNVMTAEEAQRQIDARRLQLENQVNPQRVLPPTSLGQPGVPGANPPPTVNEPEPEITLNSHRLNDVVRAANVIRSSSDLERVKVRRTEPVTGEKKEMTFDLMRVDKRSDLWLRDGDVIEIPEKQ